MKCAGIAQAEPESEQLCSVGSLFLQDAAGNYASSAVVERCKAAAPPRLKANTLGTPDLSGRGVLQRGALPDKSGVPCLWGNKHRNQFVMSNVVLSWRIGR
jgi:hypothetical protein